MLNGINFANDYQKDSYNKRIFIEKKIDEKNILLTLKKRSYILKMWNSKNLKLQRNVSKLF
jgi:hypothetical protein